MALCEAYQKRMKPGVLIGHYEVLIEDRAGDIFREVLGDEKAFSGDQ